MSATNIITHLRLTEIPSFEPIFLVQTLIPLLPDLITVQGPSVLRHARAARASTSTISSFYGFWDRSLGLLSQDEPIAGKAGPSTNRVRIDCVL